ncbi:MAG: hypothetical protein ACPGYY_03245 [Bacteroidia bacterium]
MPLAWVDEIAGLEPAINFLKGEGYTSRLWPYDGVDKQFLAYLPLQGWLHIASQKVLSFSIYNVRLPYAIFLLAGALILFKSLRSSSVSLIISLAICMLILNEKSLFETTRGVRVEPIAFFLLSSAYYGYSIKNKHVLALASTSMVFLHPYIWPAALVLFLSTSIRENSKSSIVSTLKPTRFWLYPTLALVGYLIYIHGDITLFLDQFSAQASKHETFGGLGQRIYNHFVLRFWPYYITQPYIPIVIYAALFSSILKVYRKQWTFIDISLILTHVAWILAIGPMHRYNSVLVILSLLTLIPYLSKIELRQKLNWRLVFIVLTLGISCLDVTSRQVMATVQREERNPKHYISWLKRHIPPGKSIISGHEIAYYPSAYNDDLDFFLFNTVPYRFEFESYDNLLFISDEKIHDCTLLSTYKTRSKYDWDWLKNSGTKTYNNLHLYEATSPSIYREVLKKKRVRNTEINNRSKYQ